MNLILYPNRYIIISILFNTSMTVIDDKDLIFVIRNLGIHLFSSEPCWLNWSTYYFVIHFGAHVYEEPCSLNRTTYSSVIRLFVWKLTQRKRVNTLLEESIQNIQINHPCALWLCLVPVAFTAINDQLYSMLFYIIITIIIDLVAKNLSCYISYLKQILMIVYRNLINELQILLFKFLLLFL